MRLFSLLFLSILFVACVAQPSFEWDSRLENLKIELLSLACTPEDQAFYEELIASQSLSLDYEEMVASLQNMQKDIRCD